MLNIASDLKDDSASVILHLDEDSMVILSGAEVRNSVDIASHCVPIDFSRGIEQALEASLTVNFEDEYAQLCT